MVTATIQEERTIESLRGTFSEKTTNEPLRTGKVLGQVSHSSLALFEFAAVALAVHANDDGTTSGDAVDEARVVG